MGRRMVWFKAGDIKRGHTWRELNELTVNIYLTLKNMSVMIYMCCLHSIFQITRWDTIIFIPILKLRSLGFEDELSYNMLLWSLGLRCEFRLVWFLSQSSKELVVPQSSNFPFSLGSASPTSFWVSYLVAFSQSWPRQNQNASEKESTKLRLSCSHVK